MNFMTNGNYSFAEGVLSFYAEQDARRYPVAIERAFFEERYGATPSGDFHEYWALVLDNRTELEAIVARKLETTGAAPGTPITISTTDIDNR